MRMIDAYKRVQWSESVARVQHKAHRAINVQRNKILNEKCATSGQRLSHVARLAFATGFGAVMGPVLRKGTESALFAHPFHYLNVITSPEAFFSANGSYLGFTKGFKECIKKASFFDSSHPPRNIFPGSITNFLQVGSLISLAVSLFGVGRYGVQPKPNSSFWANSGGLLLEHGVAGLPRYFLEEHYLASWKKGHMGTARACLLAATFLSIPQELVRSVAITAMTLWAVPLAVGVGAVASAVSVMMTLTRTTHMVSSGTCNDLLQVGVDETNYDFYFSEKRYALRDEILTGRLCMLDTFALTFVLTLQNPDDLIGRFQSNLRVVGIDTFDKSIAGAIAHIDMLMLDLQLLKDGVVLPGDSRQFESLRDVKDAFVISKFFERPGLASVWFAAIRGAAKEEYQKAISEGLKSFPPASKERAELFVTLLEKLNELGSFGAKHFWERSLEQHLDEVNVA